MHTLPVKEHSSCPGTRCLEKDAFTRTRTEWIFRDFLSSWGGSHRLLRDDEGDGLQGDEANSASASSGVWLGLGGRSRSFWGQSHCDDLNSFISLGAQKSDLVGDLLFLSDHRQQRTFCAALSLVFPGWKVEGFNLPAVSEVLRVTVDLEHISGYLFDVGIVTNHPRQWDFFQCMQLLWSENSWVFPPEPVKTFSEAYSLIVYLKVCHAGYLPRWEPGQGKSLLRFALIPQVAGTPLWKEVSPGVARSGCCDSCAEILPLPHSIARLWEAVADPPLLHPESKRHLRQRLLQITHGLELVNPYRMGLLEWAEKKSPLITGA